jgi:tellurite resistance protein
VDSLDLEGLVGSVLRGVLGGRRKRSSGALRYLTHGRSSFLNASTVLALAGVAWGLWETATQSSVPAPTVPSRSGAPGTTDVSLPPPLPGVQPPTAVVPPPIPGAASAPAPASALSVPPEIVRVLRLTLSAARADGTLAPHEREAILAQARAVGAEPLVAPELDRPRPLGEIVGGVADPRVRQDLYTLAFTIVRADEAVSPAERQYLTELSTHLGLEPDIVAELEQQAVRRIGAHAEGAQH